MPKFATYQRPQKFDRQSWGGRQGAPIPQGKRTKVPKPAPEAEKAKLPEIALPPRPNGHSESH